MGHAAEIKDLDSPRTWIQPHYGSFNGLRALAVLGVYITHYGSFWGLQRPQFFLWTGVDLFFVLSGFLITGILFDSLQKPRFFRDFYIRRALRIFPLFYALFLLLLVLTPLLQLVYTPLLWTYALYLGNFIFPFSMQNGVDISIIHVIQHGASVPVARIGHFWSLCVEEQFYLIWPAVVWWVRDRRRLMQLCVVLCALVLPLRFFLHEHYNYFFLLYESSYTRFDTLLVGAWMALWLRGRALSLRQLRRLSLVLFWVPAVIVVVMILRLPSVDTILVVRSRFVTTIGFTLIAVAYAGVILRSLDDNSLLSRILRWRPLNALGVISYGFYLIHGLIPDVLDAFVAKFPHWTFAAPVLGFAFTVAAAALSFRYLETPFLRLKSVLAPPPVKVPTIQRSSESAKHLHITEPCA